MPVVDEFTILNAQCFFASAVHASIFLTWSSDDIFPCRRGRQLFFVDGPTVPTSWSAVEDAVKPAAVQQRLRMLQYRCTRQRAANEVTLRMESRLVDEQAGGWERACSRAARRKAPGPPTYRPRIEDSSGAYSVADIRASSHTCTGAK